MDKEGIAGTRCPFSQDAQTKRMLDYVRTPSGTFGSYRSDRICSLRYITTIEMWLKSLLRLLEGRFTRAAIRISIGLLLLCWELNVPADPEAVFGVLIIAGLLADIGKFVWKYLPRLPEVRAPAAATKSVVVSSAHADAGVLWSSNNRSQGSRSESSTDDGGRTRLVAEKTGYETD
jgi:hypothetical protein